MPDMQHPKRIWEDLAAAVKSVVDVPVIAVGRINDPLDAADVLALGHADMVAMTRQQIADPETVNKMREGRTRRDSALHRLQPGMYRPPLRRHPLLVRPQPRRRLRTGTGHRHSDAGDRSGGASSSSERARPG